MKEGNDKRQVILRLPVSLYKELARWAEDDFRSVNGQIEYLLTENVKQRKKKKTPSPTQELLDKLDELKLATEDDG